MERKEKIVRLVSCDKRYMYKPYRAIAVENTSINTYETGQHIIPGDLSTKDNLTKDEMLGLKPLSEAKMKKFPHVINPDNPIMLGHLKDLNIGTFEDGTAIDPQSMAIFNFLMTCFQHCAPSKKEVRKGKDYFYIEDKEREAEKIVIESDLIFEAESLIRNKTSIRNYRDVVLLLNYKIENFNINVDNMTEIMLKKELLQACRTHTKDVISCFSKSVEDELYVLKLAHRCIISYRDGSFFDGGHFLGDSVLRVVEIIKNPGEKYAGQVNKWGKTLLEKDGFLPTSSKGANAAQNYEPQTEETIIQKFVTADNLEALKKVARYQLKLLKEEYDQFENFEELKEYLQEKFAYLK